MRVLVVIAAAICACSGRQPESLADPTGQVAVRDLVGSAYGDPLPGLTAEQQGQFEEGRIAFIENQDAPHGLGPVFNSTSCQSCHDGPPAVGGTNQRLEIRFGRRNPDGSFDPLTSLGGSLLQDHGIGAVPGYNYVAEVVPPQANVVASRRTQPLFGLGLVDATPEATFRALAELQAKQDPEVAGRPAMVSEIATGKLAVGRLGWKGSTPTLFQFSGDAYLNEMGLTNPQFPTENCPQGDCAALSHNPMPGMNDLDGRAVAKSANFMAFLGPPPRGRTSLRSTYGQSVFGAIGCALCHVPTLVTG